MASKQTGRRMNSTQKKKSNTGKANTAGRKNTNTRVSQKQRQERLRENGVIQDEIIIVLTLVISVLMYLSYFKLAGTVGNMIREFLFGFFGATAYILPIVLFFGTAIYISNIGNRAVGRKIMSAIVFFVALAALIQLIAVPYDDTMPILDYYIKAQEKGSGGGLLGGLLVMFFAKGFGTAGAYIIVIAIMAISLIVITGKAIFSILARKSRDTLSERREYQQLRRDRVREAEIHETGGRRPPKTFVIDPEVMQGTPGKKLESPGIVTGQTSEKERRRKSKEEKNIKNENQLPLVNLDHLFKGEQSEEEKVIKSPHVTSSSRVIEFPQTSSVPAYEEELRSKFGKPSEALNDIGDNIEFENEPAKGIVESSKDMADRTTGKSAYQAETTKVDRNPAEKERDSSSVELSEINQTKQVREYVFPPMSLLKAPAARPMKNGNTAQMLMLKEAAGKLQSTLDSFGVRVTITNISCGPSVTRYELQPEQGVKVKSITSLADDIKLSMAVPEVRIEAPIPGKSAVGIEVPNKENSMVTLYEILESKEFKEYSSDIAFAVGKDIGGQTIVTDIAKMPHLLIAGATGSGKSVCINTLIMSILYKANPADVRMIMIDPKVVELSVYNGIPHLLIPVVTDPKKASAALNWAVMEMTERYKKFADVNVRDLKGYNEKVAEVEHLGDENYKKLPQIVIVIDELADLMMVAPGEVEDAICRLAQMARAAGLHLIIATQRPSVNVITGLIKANVPSRIAFAVSSAIDSRTIIDGSGAEKLLGKGDMLFFPSGYPKPVRIQGAFVSDKEVSAVVDFLKNHNHEAQYSEDVNDKITNARPGEGMAGMGNERDDYFIEAAKFIIEKDKASIGMLQRVYKIGFNRAARIMDQLAEAGVVGPEEGTKPRRVLMSEEEFENYIEENG